MLSNARPKLASAFGIRASIFPPKFQFMAEIRWPGAAELSAQKTRQAPAAHEALLEPAVPSHEGTLEAGRQDFSPGGPLSGDYGVGTARKNRRVRPSEVVSM